MIESLDALSHALLLAAEAPAPASASVDPMTALWEQAVRVLVSAGPVGLVLVAILFKKGVMTVSEHETAKASWERERTGLIADNDELKAALRESNSVYTSQVIPTLTRVLDAERELVDLRRAEQAERDRQPRSRRGAAAG